MVDTLERTAGNDPEQGPKLDSYTSRYAVWIGVFVLLLFVSDFDRNSNYYLLYDPILLVAALVLTLTFVIRLGVNVFRRNWRRTVSIIAAPIFVAPLLFVLGRLGISTELIRLELWKSSYLAEVDALPATGDPRFKIWAWGSRGGVAVANIFWTLVYDESDQIALPRSSWSAKWLQKADEATKGSGTGFYPVLHPKDFTLNVEERDRNIHVRRLEGHFYVVEDVF